MDCVYEMGGLRIVDLTKQLDPKTETRSVTFTDSTREARFPTSTR